MCDIYLTLLTL